MKCLGTTAAICGLTVMLFSAAMPASLAATWYVSTTGSDSNSGTVASPFATLTRALSSTKSGDTVDMNGGTYYLYGNPVSVNTSGTASAPITIQSTPGQSAIINAAGIYNGSHDGIDINANYIVMQNLMVEYAPVINVAISNGSYDTVQNCTFAWSTWTGVSIGEPGDANEMSHDEILNCTVHDCDQVNVNGGGANWGSGIIMANCQWSTVQNNTVYHNWGEGIGSYGGNSFGDMPSANNWVCSNTIYDNWSVELYLSDVQNITTENNFIYADGNAPLRNIGFNAGPQPAVGIAAANETSGAAYQDSGCQIFNNIVVGGAFCFRYVNGNTSSGFYPGGLNGFSFYNNVFYNSGGIGCVWIDQDPGNSFAFSNNIIWETNNSAMVACNNDNVNGHKDAGEWTNCWDGNGANNMISWGSDLTLWNTDPGFARSGFDSPPDYLLSLSSPCYAAGSNLSYSPLTFDFNWVSRPSTGSWTMGAFANSNN